MDSSECEKPQLCHSCCEFFGNKDREWLCSKCYKVKSKSDDSKPNSPPNTSILSKSDLMDIEPLPSQLTTNSSFEEAKVECMITEIVQQKAEDKKIQSEPNKCDKCSKKVGLLGFKCPCELTFCKSHRLPENHECEYDFTRVAKEKLAKENPVVKASKIERF